MKITGEIKEYDKDFWRIHLHQGNALNRDCIDKDFFKEGYKYDHVNDKVTIGERFTLKGRRTY